MKMECGLRSAVALLPHLHHALVESPVLVQRLVGADDLVQRNQHCQNVAKTFKHRLQQQRQQQ